MYSTRNTLLLDSTDQDYPADYNKTVQIKIHYCIIAKI